METYAQTVIWQSVNPTCGREVCDFMEQIGPTLMGVKPACILSGGIPARDRHISGLSVQGGLP